MNARSLAVACPRCHASEEVSPDALDRKLRCKSCGASFRLVARASAPLDLLRDRRTAELRLLVGTLTCSVGVAWVLLASVSDASVALAAVESLVVLLPGAALLLEAAGRVDAIDAVVREDAALARRARRRTTRRFLAGLGR